MSNSPFLHPTDFVENAWVFHSQKHQVCLFYQYAGQFSILIDPYVDPEYKLYMSSVVMRIPGYNGDMEEPWYWENFGRDIYEFSYYTDKDEAQ